MVQEKRARAEARRVRHFEQLGEARRAVAAAKTEAEVTGRVKIFYKLAVLTNTAVTSTGRKQEDKRHICANPFIFAMPTHHDMCSSERNQRHGCKLQHMSISEPQHEAKGCTHAVDEIGSRCRPSS